MMLTPNAPIETPYRRLVPTENAAAVRRGDECANALKNGFFADFERTPDWCARHMQTNPDRMVHVSTFERIDGRIYMTYYANVGTDAEDPLFQEARLAFCPEDAPQELTVLTVQRAGDTFNGQTVDRLYDTILAYRGGDALYILWTASLDGNYHRLYRIYNVKTQTFSPIGINRFQVGSVTENFSITGLSAALDANGIPIKKLYSDIGIMQKMTVRVENGETWYYSGAYSWYWNAIIKSRDFVTWEYAAAPDFPNGSKWENAVYVYGDRVYYFVRQEDCYPDGFLTYYDLQKKQWAAPLLVQDAQSRSDFFEYRGRLYLVHAPIDRSGFGIVRVDTEELSRSTAVAVARMGDSLFYPYVKVYGDTLWMSYTVDRKHIRLGHFSLKGLDEA